MWIDRSKKKKKYAPTKISTVKLKFSFEFPDALQY